MDVNEVQDKGAMKRKWGRNLFPKRKVAMFGEFTKILQKSFNHDKTLPTKIGNPKEESVYDKWLRHGSAGVF